ncbi:MAG: HipA N-terminal domain [Pseudomonadota bacterium]|jgi:HipA-like protein
MKRLSVYLGGQLVGYLLEGDGKGLSFGYVPDWLKQPNAISVCPELPLSDASLCTLLPIELK